MISALIVACGLVSASPAEANPSESELASYRSAKAEARRDPDAHVRLALWCERHGMPAERLRHLMIAVLADPSHATARGLLGLVADADRWRKPAEVEERVQADTDLAAKLAEYNGRRATAAETADAQWELAVWCEQNGLDAEATAHLTAVTRLDPGREAAWKRLGYKKHGGRWRTEAQVTAEAEEVEAQKEADRRWGPLLAEARANLARDGSRAEAEAFLAGVDDPRAVPSVWRAFGKGGEADQARAAQLLGQIDAPSASRALVALAVWSRSAEVRRVAGETLVRRDPREYADLLIGLIRRPIRFEVKPVAGPGSPGELLVAGEKVDRRRFYIPPPLPAVRLQPGDILDYDARGLPVISRRTIYEAYAGPSATLSGYANISAPMIGAAQQGGGRLPAGVPGADFINAHANAHAQAVPALPGYPGISNLPGNFRGALATDPLLGHPMLGGLGWDSLAAGFGVPDFGTQSYNPAMFPTIPTNPATLRNRVVLSRGPLGVRNTYNVFERDERIPVGAMMADGPALSAAAAQRRLDEDVERIEAYNRSIRPLNDQVTGLLAEAAGKDFGDDREVWKAWYIDQIGYAYNPQRYTDKPTIMERVIAPSPLVPITVQQYSLGSYQRTSCFGAGTPVQTRSGTLPIERLQVGDLVLAQDPTTGALGYQAVVAVHHNPPSPTFVVGIGDESIVSSPFHRFWKAGEGWVMARELEVGDVIRTLEGLQAVESLEAGEVQPVFNLDVAGSASFFVGGGGVLVHDNTLPEPSLRPFDASPSLAKAGTKED